MIKNGNLAAVIIRPDYVLTPEGLKKGWDIRIKEGWIACVGPWGALGSGSNEGVQTVCLPGQMLLPGSANGRNHTYGVLSYGITAEAVVADFSDYLKDFWWPYVEDRVDHDLARITARWAYVEVTGPRATSFMDILERPNSIPGAPAVEKEEVEKVDLWGSSSFEACERKSGENGRLGLKEDFDFAKAYNEENDLMKGVVNIHTLFTCNEDSIREAKCMADEAGCLFYIHISESNLEPTWARGYLKTTPVEVYDDMGYSDENVLASQLVQVADKEIAVLAGKDVNAIPVPLSNCEVGGGIVPIEKVPKAGMTVGLGMDGYMNNFFEVIRGAFLIREGHHKDPQTMPVRKVHRMATELGAKAVGIKAGIIKEGTLADPITVDVARPTSISEYNVYDQLVLLTNPRSMINVTVGGVWLKRDGKLMTLDKEAMCREVEEKIERFWEGGSECR